MTEIIRIGNWNVEWASAKSKRAVFVNRILGNLDADILCVTEGYPHNFPEGHVIASRAYGGAKDNSDGHKVMLWSQTGWSNVDSLGSPNLPEGRFIAGTTETAIGLLRIIGVAIPYFGYRTTASWGEDRLGSNEGKQRYLQVLFDEILPTLNSAERTIIVGDFNLRIPRYGGYPTKKVDELRQQVFQQWHIPTSGINPEAFEVIQPIPEAANPQTIDGHIIDHLAHSQDLEAVSVQRWSRLLADGTRLSDHHGILVKLRRR